MGCCPFQKPSRGTNPRHSLSEQRLADEPRATNYVYEPYRALSCLHIVCGVIARSFSVHVWKSALCAIPVKSDKQTI